MTQSGKKTGTLKQMQRESEVKESIRKLAEAAFQYYDSHGKWLAKILQPQRIEDEITPPRGPDPK